MIAHERLTSNYFVDVGKNTIKGFMVFGGLLIVLAPFFFFFAAFFSFDDPLLEEQRIWCEQYHPTLSFSECSEEAGW